MKKNEICKNCKYFQESYKLPAWRKHWGYSKDQVFGECRKYAIVRAWPEVEGHLFCGEFKKEGKE